MTIRMQESEAAENFSRFLAHLEAGDQVQLQREGKPSVTIYNVGTRPQPSHIDDIEREQRKFHEEHGPVTLEPEVVDLLRRASAEFRGQALEPRVTE